MLPCKPCGQGLPAAQARQIAPPALRGQLSMTDALGPNDSVAGYRLLRLLGAGAQSRVYLASPPGDGPAVALKIAALGSPDPEAAAPAEFLRATRIARALAHPHIVAIEASGLEGPLGWLAMEFIEGGDLAPYTRPRQRLPDAEVLGIAVQLCGALAHAHRQGVVHRDLKPENVLVDRPRDIIKLADFGLARLSGAGQTGTGIVLGTPAYMAPEQLAGNAPTAQTDLYALGVLLFQLFTARLPHEASSMGELLRQVALEPAPALSSLRPELPAALDRLLQRLLQKSPRQRPPSAASVGGEFAQLLLAARSGGSKSH